MPEPGPSRGDRSAIDLTWESLPCGLFRTDLNGQVLYVNQRWCDISGVTREQAEGRRLFERVHALDCARVEAAWGRCGENGFRFEFRLRSQSGPLVWILAQVLPQRDAAGNVVEFVGTFADITDQKRAEETLRLNEARFRAVFGFAPEGMAVTGPDGRFLQVNQRLCQILGYTEGELLQMRFQDVTFPGDLDRSLDGAKALLKGALELFEYEKRYVRKDGAILWMILRSNLLRDSAGNPVYFISHIHDITERKRAEAALRESEARYWSLVDLSNDGILVHVQGKLVFVNPAAARILGATTREELVGRDLLDLVHPEFRTIVQERVREIGQEITFQPFVSEKLIRLDGVEVHVEVAAVPFVFNRQVAVQVIFRDISNEIAARQDHDRLFRQVEAARDELRSLSRRLVEVQEVERRRIARELHDEIGQELTALRLSIERSGTAEAAEARWQEAYEQVTNILRVVRDLSLDLRPTMLDDLGLVPALLWHLDRLQSLSGMKVQFKHFGVEGRRFPAEIETGAYRIIQEALTNSLRHSNVKQVQLMLWISEPGPHLVIQVEDHGVGFDSRAIDHGRSSGLSGMRERAMLLGGEFRIESAPGEGACVTAALPLEPAPAINDH